MMRAAGSASGSNQCGASLLLKRAMPSYRGQVRLIPDPGLPHMMVVVAGGGGVVEVCEIGFEAGAARPRPRFRRRRVRLLEDAVIGLAPHNAAKDAFAVTTIVVPAGDDEHLPGVTGGDSKLERRSRRGDRIAGPELRSPAQMPYALGDRAQREFLSGLRSGELGDSEPCTDRRLVRQGPSRGQSVP